MYKNHFIVLFNSSEIANMKKIQTITQSHLRLLRLQTSSIIPALRNTEVP